MRHLDEGEPEIHDDGPEPEDRATMSAAEYVEALLSTLPDHSPIEPG